MFDCMKPENRAKRIQKYVSEIRSALGFKQSPLRGAMFDCMKPENRAKRIQKYVSEIRRASGFKQSPLAASCDDDGHPQ